MSCLQLSLLAGESVNSGHAEVRLLSNLQSQQDETFYLGIEMAMDKGWHTYWQNPGDSGGAFDVIWESPEGFIIENVSWPTDVFNNKTLRTFPDNIKSTSRITWILPISMPPLIHCHLNA